MSRDDEEEGRGEAEAGLGCGEETPSSSEESPASASRSSSRLAIVSSSKENRKQKAGGFPRHSGSTEGAHGGTRVKDEGVRIRVCDGDGEFKWRV